MTEPITERQPNLLFEWLVEHKERRVVLLAGYPRSGAALVRTVLVHCFGQKTSTIYNERDMPGYEGAMQLVHFPMTAPELTTLLDRQGMLTVKTHQAPCVGKPLPTIMIVRDGRRTLESLRAFYHDRNEIEVSVDAMIAGDHPWGDWSQWTRAWAMNSPSDTLWLRYEDIMADVPGTVALIAGRFGLTPIGYSIPTFEETRASVPGGDVVRKADVTSNGGLTPAQEEAFWRRHGGTMSMLGYQRRV